MASDEQNPIEIKLEGDMMATKPEAVSVDIGKKFIGGLAAALILVFTAGLVWFFGFSPSSPIGASWFLFSFAAGLSMIVLPCTLPLAFVIVPLSMGRGARKGFSIALAFSLGIAVTLSVYGVLAALVGEVAIGTLGAPLETVKNWLYFIAGLATYLFAFGELGLISLRMPAYSGAHPGFIQRQGDIFKAFLLGLFLGNIGVGCPHPATPLLLTRIAVSGDVFYGWLLFFVHALGRVAPLMILAILGIIGINALSWIVARRERIEKTTGWAMVFVAGFILVLGLFTHDWWVYSGSHSLLEQVTQEERFVGIISERLGVESPHEHGIAELAGKTGLFGLPLWLGNWALVFLWAFPMFWYRFKFGGAKTMFWVFVLLTLLLGIIFIYTIPHWFLEHKTLEGGGKSQVEVDIRSAAPIISNGPLQFEILIKDKGGRNLVDALKYSHERLIHAVIIHEDLKLFAHIHPEDFEVLTSDMFNNGIFPLSVEFPQKGRYIFAVSFNYMGEEIIFSKTLDVEGRAPSTLIKDFSRHGNFDGLDVGLEIELKQLIAEAESHLKYRFENQGRPVEDLEFYLAAPMHFAIVSADLSNFAHTHGTLSAEEGPHESWKFLPEAFAHEGEEEDSRKDESQKLPDKFGPEIFLHYTFPYPGIYAIFGEAKWQGKVILTKFMVEVGVGKGGSIVAPRGH